MKTKLPVGAIAAIVAVAVIALGAFMFKGAQGLGEQAAPKPDASRFLPKTTQGTTPPPTQ
jgi:hypothetical protein